MSWLLNRSTRTKLFLGFGLMLAYLLGANIAAYLGYQSIQANKQSLHNEGFVTVIDLKELRHNQVAIVADMLTLLLVNDPIIFERTRQQIEETQRRNDALLRVLQQQTEDTPSLYSDLQEFVTVRNSFDEAWETDVLPLVRAGSMDEAAVLMLGGQTERHAEMQAIAARLVDEAIRNADDAELVAERTTNRALQIFLFFGMIAVVTGLGVALFIDRIITIPLTTISDAANRVAAGDLTVHIATNERTDEVGALTRTFRRMVESLREVTREIREGVIIMASSTSEIIAATAQVVANADATATASGAVTVIVDGVKQTAQTVNHNAKFVSDTAQRSVQVSHSGKQAVDGTILGMNRIKEQMDSIAETIVRLSEQSFAIGEIITTVSDLAEQSNLLAVNAAIEAAKAGESGRGFAVVAQEVRNLAEQSKQAAIQVRNILGDTQKATSAAVMATEQGSKAVEAGVRQSTEASEAIRTLTHSITEAAQAAIQITTSTEQQLLGIEQMNQAIEGIKVTSAKNVTSTKQVEANAQSLYELGQKLKQLIEHFNV